MQSNASGAMKHSAEMIPRHSDLSGNVSKCHRFVKTRTKDEFNLAHRLTLFGPDPLNPYRRSTICRSDYSFEQVHDRFFNRKNIQRLDLRELAENSSLQKVGFGIGPTVGESERGFRTLIHFRIESSNHVSDYVNVHPEPIAVIAFGADCASKVRLAPVIECHHLRIRNERPLVLVVNLDRSSRKNEAAISGRSRILESGMVGMTSKSAHTSKIPVEHNLIKFTRRRVPHCPIIARVQPFRSMGKRVLPPEIQRPLLSNFAVTDCPVHCRDLQGVEHSVSITAETLYEAVAGSSDPSFRRLGRGNRQGHDLPSRHGHTSHHHSRGPDAGVREMAETLERISC
jgi:hypothetical protein